MAISVESVTLATLEPSLREAARNLPDDPHKPDSMTWGLGFATQLISHASPEMSERISEIFSEFLLRGSPEQRLLAAKAYPERVGVTTAIVKVLARDDLPSETETALLSSLGRAISLGALPYKKTYREYASHPERRALIQAFLLYDHDWFLENLKTLLEKKISVAASHLWFGIVRLPRPELEALRAGIEARREQLGDRYTNRLIKVIDREWRDAPEGDAPPRWETSS